MSDARQNDRQPYALVTGASRGIGAAIAERLAADGFDLVINFRSKREAAEAVAARVRALGRAAELLPFDVADRAAAKAALTDLLDRRGAPRVLVLSAGIARDAVFAGMTDEEWDAVVGTALGGFYNVVRPLALAMCKARAGRIVTLASVSGQMGNAGQVNYSAAKGGVIAGTKALAREIAKRGLTANVVAPGLIDTEMIQGLPLEQMLAAVPAGRLGTPREVAAVVAFLCSADAAYITGQVIAVNGGLYT
ncbi:MAG TPA: 3-oxoacyl-ACP reductase FabG [Planctomycetota bacterium]|nr:3-oxoacyl-ACP reductase FabG [Planctomycetota bacterium]